MASKNHDRKFLGLVVECSTTRENLEMLGGTFSHIYKGQRNATKDLTGCDERKSAIGWLCQEVQTLISVS